MHALDVFVLVSGCFSILATAPLLYLAIHAHRDTGELRRMQRELNSLVAEVRGVQHEIHHDQREAANDLVKTRETIQRVADATSKRRRLPRLRVEVVRDQR
jgi:hypothetical protein